MLDYTLSNYYRLTRDGEFPAPCKDDPDRVLEFGTNDIFTKDPKDGSYTVHTGIMIFGIRLPDDAVEFVDKPIRLVG